MNEHDLLASRLCLILERLFLGETLSVTELAGEFNVSERTIRRDFNERLINLPNIELDIVRRGHYRLSNLYLTALRSYKDIKQFGKITYIDRLFPAFAFEKKFIASLLLNKKQSPFVIYTAPLDNPLSAFSGFSSITEAIMDNVLIHFSSRKRSYSDFAPYRLIYFKRQWFLVGEFEQSIAVIAYESMINIDISKKKFSINPAIFDVTHDEAFIQALPHFSYSINLYHQFKQNIS